MTTQLGRDDLVLCAGTIPDAGFRERVEAAAAGGFSAISLWGRDYRRGRTEGLSDADMRALLDDHGLAVAELDGVGQWWPGSSGMAPPVEGDEADSFFAFTEQDMYAIADAVGARSINAVEVYSATDVPLDDAADAFAALCDRAAEHGLVVHLEYLPWSAIPDPRTAAEILERADRPNGGVLVDSWHHFRSGSDDGALRSVPPERVVAVQLNDAPQQPEDDLVDECLHRRLVPGEGAIDLVGLVQLLDEMGSEAPIGVEVMSDEVFALPAKDAAKRVGDATRGVLAAARGERRRETT
jgi:sugar phosphate isomerase/epimerase